MNVLNSKKLMKTVSNACNIEIEIEKSSKPVRVQGHSSGWLGFEQGLGPIPGDLRKRIGWLNRPETCCNLEFDFQKFLKNFDNIRVVVGARVFSVACNTACWLFIEEFERGKRVKKDWLINVQYFPFK